MDEDDKIRRNLVVFSAVVLWISIIGIKVKLPATSLFFELQDTDRLTPFQVWATVAAVHIYLILRFIHRRVEDENLPTWWQELCRNTRRSYQHLALIECRRVFGDGSLLQPRRVAYPFKCKGIRTGPHELTTREYGEEVPYHKDMDFVSLADHTFDVGKIDALGTSTIVIRVASPTTPDPDQPRSKVWLTLRFHPWRALPRMVCAELWRINFNSRQGMERFFPALIATLGFCATLYKLGESVLATYYG